MPEETVQSIIAQASRLVDQAEELAALFRQKPGPLEYEQVLEEIELVLDKLEEAQSILLETEIEGVPDMAEPPSEGEEVEDDDIPDEAQELMLAKQSIEYRSSLVEADLYRGAADLVGEPISHPTKVTEQQYELLGKAGVALEAAFGSIQDPEGLLRLAELRVLQLEIKRALQVCGVIEQLDPDGEFGRRARELQERIQADPELKDRGRCFIATAVCGPGEPEVVALQRFRDQVLMHRTAGRLFVKSYYTCSPPIAHLLESNATARKIVRTWLVRPAAAAAARLCGRG